VFLVLAVAILIGLAAIVVAYGSSWTLDLHATAVRGFSWIAGLALVLAAVVLFSSAGQGSAWAASLIGLGAGIALLVVSQLVAAKYPATANVLAGTAIGVLYATVYAMHVRWGLLPLLVMIIGMLLVSAAAIYVALRRDSAFVAVAALIGGFLTPALSPGDALPRFSYLLIVTAGVVWLAWKKQWPALAAIAVALSAIYQWTWVLQSVTVSQVALAATIFAAFAIVGTLPLWYGQRDERPPRFEWIAVAAAHLPLLFAIYVASQTNYASQYNVLFAFLLFIDAGLLAIVWRGGPKWLHAAGGIATLITFIIWLRVSYTHASWPWLVVWLALFVALYLIKATPFAGLLFASFIGIAIREPAEWAAIVAAMLVMLAVVVVVNVRRGQPFTAAIAIAFSSIALMMLHPPLYTLIALHVLLFAALFAVAWISGRHVLAILAVPFLVAMVITAYSPAAWTQYSATTLLFIAAVPYLLFIAYPLALGARAKASLAPYTAAALASLVLLLIAWTTPFAGIVALVEAVLMAVLLWRALKLEPREPRVTLLLALTLALSDIAIALLLPKPWTVTLFALGVVVLVWLFLRFHHPLLLLWGTGLAAFVFLRLAFDGDLFGVVWYAFNIYWPAYIALYAVCGVAMFAAAYLIRVENPLLQRVFSVACLFELWFLINILIANCYHSSNGAVVFDFVASSAVESALYTIAWAVIATGLLILSYLIRWPAARGAALSLLLAAILKSVVSDLSHLPPGTLVAALVALGGSLAVVAFVLQRRWVGKSIGLDLPV